jgi:hypothetical protein
MHWKIPRWILVIAAGAVCAKVIRELMSALDSPPQISGNIFEFLVLLLLLQAPYLRPRPLWRRPSYRVWLALSAMMAVFLTVMMAALEHQGWRIGQP